MGLLTFSILLLAGILIFMARNFGCVDYYEGERVIALSTEHDSYNTMFLAY